MKNNPLQDYYAGTFGMTQPQCNVWTHHLSDILLKTLKSESFSYLKLMMGMYTIKKIADEQTLNLPTGITLWQDTAFNGYNPKNVNIKMPTKKPRRKELTSAQKESNREISRFRILVEHVICGVKKCRIVKERFRCGKFGFDDLVMLIVCGLHNFRIDLKICDIELYRI